MILWLTFQAFFVIISANMRCSNESPQLIPKYYLIEKCRRSQLAVVARANYASLASCQRLGIEKKALALNFSPQETLDLRDERPEYTCEVLSCAEVRGGLSLTNDTRFDYYSIYANHIPDVNSTCVPATGLFHFVQRKLNYTQAAAACAAVSGVLAGISSEQRTDTLAQFILAAKVDAAYVGMRRYNTTKFVDTNGDSLECTTYRAWAPGHPRRQFRQYECAVITQHRTWKSTRCREKRSALCELVPGGPYKIGSIFAKTSQAIDIGQKTSVEDSKSNNITVTTV